MRIKSILSELNLDGKKAEVYLACLRRGRSTAYAIAKETGIKRPTVYDTVEQLTHEGLLHKTISGTAKYYSPTDPNVLLERLQEKEHNLLQIMPKLQSIYTSPKNKPAIHFFTGKSGIKEMYADSLRTLHKGDEILAFVGEDILKNIPQYAAAYVRDRTKKGIRLRGFYKNTDAVHQYMRRNQEQLRAVILLDPSEFNMGNEINIYKDKVAIASYQDEMFGVIIESKEVSHALRAIFELVWLCKKP